MQTKAPTAEAAAPATPIPESDPRKKSVTFAVGKRLRRPIGRFFVRQSLVGDPTIFPAGTFAWTKTLEDAAPAMRDELSRLLARREALPAFETISSYNSRIALADNWKVFVLFGFGKKSERNCALAPATTRALESIPGLKTAWFSILSPRYHVPAHKGITKGLVRCHVGLIVPKEKTKCRMMVGEESFHWEEGRAIVFDDSRRHEVRNDTDEERVVLLLDVDRPMRWPGRVMLKLFLSAMRLTGYYRDAARRQKAWEDRFHGAGTAAD